MTDQVQFPGLARLSEAMAAARRRGEPGFTTTTVRMADLVINDDFVDSFNRAINRAAIPMDAFTRWHQALNRWVDQPRLEEPDTIPDTTTPVPTGKRAIQL